MVDEVFGYAILIQNDFSPTYILVTVKCKSYIACKTTDRKNCNSQLFFIGYTASNSVQNAVSFSLISKSIKHFEQCERSVYKHIK